MVKAALWRMAPTTTAAQHWPLPPTLPLIHQHSIGILISADMARLEIMIAGTVCMEIIGSILETWQLELNLFTARRQLLLNGWHPLICKSFNWPTIISTVITSSLQTNAWVVLGLKSVKNGIGQHYICNYWPKLKKLNPWPLKHIDIDMGQSPLSNGSIES